MAQAQDHHDVYEAARILGLSPARVRQMLRSGELEGERAEGHTKGVPGPWRVSARSVRTLHAGQEDTERGEPRDAGEDAAETVALAGDLAGQAVEEKSGAETGGTPSEAAELLSESVRGLMEKVEALKRELEQLEGRLEFSEIQEFAVQASLRRERERADALQAELEAERRRGGGRRGSRRGSVGG